MSDVNLHFFSRWVGYVLGSAAAQRVESACAPLYSLLDRFVGTVRSWSPWGKHHGDATPPPDPAAGLRRPQAAFTVAQQPLAPPDTVNWRGLELCGANDTEDERAANRARYVDKMRQPHTWASEAEAHVLAQACGLRVRYWRDSPEQGSYTRADGHGEPPAGDGRFVDLVHGGGHYRAIIGHEPGLAHRSLIAYGETHVVDVEGEGDCLFLALAYAADMADMRLIRDAQSKGCVGDLRQNAGVMARLEQPAADDGALYRQLRDAVVHAMRQETAEQLLRQPDLVDILVATCLAEVSEEDWALARDQELARTL